MSKDEAFSTIMSFETEFSDRVAREMRGVAHEDFGDHLGLAEFAIENMAFGIQICFCEMLGVYENVNTDESDILWKCIRDHVYAVLVEKAMKKDKEDGHE